MLVHPNVAFLYDLLPAECGTQQTAVTKITGLLRVGFGGAGADIISKVKKQETFVLNVHAHCYLHRSFLSSSTTVMICFLIYSISAWIG